MGELCRSTVQVTTEISFGCLDCPSKKRVVIPNATPIAVDQSQLPPHDLSVKIGISGDTEVKIDTGNIGFMGAPCENTARCENVDRIQSTAEQLGAMPSVLNDQLEPPVDRVDYEI
jgi:hypothetical protein